MLLPNSYNLIFWCLFAYTPFAVDTVVSLSDSKYGGTPLSNGITQWLGIPFAAPPVGDLRFAPPVDPPKRIGIQPADRQGPLCIATRSTGVHSSESEDCLYLAVYAPSTATTKSNLPVFVFIHGGGFNTDSNPNLNGSGLIEASGHSIVVVTFNYRIGPWGFLAGSSSSSGQLIANNGLRDQRKVFEWVKRHISAFGGDPSHVTIGGDSAGAASVALHLTAYGGRNDNLFQAAAAESVSFATVLTSSESQYQYNNLIHAVGCNHISPAASLACLRNKPAAEIQAKNINIPYPGRSEAPIYMFDPTIDNDFITDLTYTAFERGKFIKVPVIFGDDTNGGTIFTPRSTSSQEESNTFLKSQFPYLTTAQLNEIAKLFSNSCGNDCDESGYWWRQVSDAYGEMRYMCPSLYISSAYANVSESHGYIDESKLKTAKNQRDEALHGSHGHIHRRVAVTHSHSPNNHGTKNIPPTSKSWAYRYDVEDPSQVNSGLGVPHTAEINAIFGPNYISPSSPASYYPGGKNEEIVPVIQAYWTSFIRTYDPNTYKLERSAHWDTYYGVDHEPQRMLFGTGGRTEMELVDRGQRARCAYLQAIGPSVKQRRDDVV